MREPVGPETIAALLDGTLPADERERVLAAIAADPELRAQLGDAAAVLEELEHPAAAVRTPRRHWWGALAAVLAAVVLVPVALRDRDPVTVLIESGLRPPRASGWADIGWSATRGTATQAAAEQNALRMGVRFAQLHVALAESSVLDLETIRADLMGLTSALPGGAPVAALIGRATGEERSARDLGRRLETTSGTPDWFVLGLRLEVVRLAALTGGAVLLRDPATASDLSKLGNRIPGPAAAEVAAVVQAIADVTGEDLGPVADRAGEALRALAP